MKYIKLLTISFLLFFGCQDAQQTQISKSSFAITKNYEPCPCPQFDEIMDELVEGVERGEIDPSLLNDALEETEKIIKKRGHKRVDIEGERPVYMLPDLDEGSINLNNLDSSVPEGVVKRIKNGATNRDLMDDAIAPIGPDGKQIDLHHVLGREPSIMAEFVKSDHQKSTNKLHDLVTESWRHIPGKKNEYKKFKDKWYKYIRPRKDD